MSRLVDLPEEDAAQPQDTSVLVKNGRAPKAKPKHLEAEVVAPPPPSTAAPDKPTAPLLLVLLAVVVAATFFFLFFTRLGFSFRSKLLYPRLHRSKLTDEYGNPTLRKRFWNR